MEANQSYYSESVAVQGDDQFNGRSLLGYDLFSSFDSPRQTIDPHNAKMTKSASESGYLSPIFSPACSLSYSSSSLSDNSVGPSTPMACSTLPADQAGKMNSSDLIAPMCFANTSCEPLSIIIDANESVSQFTQSDEVEPLLVPKFYINLNRAEQRHYQMLLSKRVSSCNAESSPVSTKQRKAQ